VPSIWLSDENREADPAQLSFGEPGPKAALITVASAPVITSLATS